MSFIPSYPGTVLFVECLRDLMKLSFPVFLDKDLILLDTCLILIFLVFTIYVMHMHMIGGFMMKLMISECFRKILQDLLVWGWFYIGK